MVGVGAVFDLPPNPPAPDYTVCFIQAAKMYTLPPSLLPAISKIEGGKIGASSENTDGTRDHGFMQINDVRITELKKRFPITADIIRNDPCAAIRVAGYIVRDEINRAGGDFWKGVGRYHSRTPALHANYVQKVFPVAKQLEPTYRVLAARLAMN